MIRSLGTVPLPDEAVAYAETIKLESYATNTPAEFQVRELAGSASLADAIAQKAGLTPGERARLDLVYFSCAKGAEPHVDRLPAFEPRTWVVPLVLPQDGQAILLAGRESAVAVLGGLYEFDHTQSHALHLDDTRTGCVFAMAALVREGREKPRRGERGGAVPAAAKAEAP
jgi:hypothetical protein